MAFMHRTVHLTCCLLFVGLLCGSVSRAAHPEHGLLWNRTGLPLVFPLVVTTPAGQSYFVVLKDAKTGVPALAAFIGADRFFRILVPPGAYDVRFVKQDDWNAETERAKESAVGDVVKVPEPLSFAVINPATKAGHRIDLTQQDPDGRTVPVLSALNLCQSIVIARPPHPQAPFDNIVGYATRISPAGEIVHHPDARFDPQRLTGRDTPANPTGYAPYFSPPGTAVRSRPCVPTGSGE